MVPDMTQMAWQWNENVQLTSVGDHQVVLVNRASGEVFVLNRTASWLSEHLLLDSLDALVAAAERAFAVSADRAREEILDFVGTLKQRGWLTGGPE